MSDVTETLLIETKNGPVRINKSDYDAKKHKLSSAAIPATPAPVNPPANPTPGTDNNNSGGGEGGGNSDNPGGNDVVQYGVIKKKNKFIAVNAATGEPIIGVEGIDPEGYASNADAWAAVTAATAPKPGDNSGS